MRATACAECGNSIHSKGIGRPRRFCSDGCKRKAGNRRHRRALPPLRSSLERVCARCGAQFVSVRRNNVYCSPPCANAVFDLRRRQGLSGVQEKNCDGCRSTFTAKTARARWCSRACANRHYGNLRVRQRAQLSAVSYTDLEIFERDGWRCHLCRILVDRTVSRTHEDGATIDHLVPIAEGGLDEPANVATAHWRCNRGKRTRPMNEQLALL